MSKPKVIVVDENDKVIGYKERNDRDQKDIIRVAAVWIENEKGEVLIAQRSWNKSHHPGKWGPAAAGTVEEGETYEDNILKEVEEEIGIVIDKNAAVFVGSFFAESIHKYFTGTFFAKISSETKFVLQEEEVAAVKWVSWEWLENDVLENPENYLISLERGIMKNIKEWKQTL